MRHVVHSDDTPAVPNSSARAIPEVLRLETVTLRYPSRKGTITALENMSLSVRDGEFVSVLGPSGCGKSTLLKVVAGLLAPDMGCVSIAGMPVTGPRHDVGVVFQQPTLLPWKNVLENVLVPIRALRLPVETYRKRAIDLLGLVGLGDFLENYPYELSGGMQQRVGIARGLVHDPKILLMDEPFAALDAMSREFMMQELQSIWKSTGKSVLFITHSIQEAVFLSDRVITLSGRPGRVIDSREIELARPRTLDAMASVQFSERCSQLRALFDRSGVLGIRTGSV